MLGKARLNSDTAVGTDRLWLDLVAKKPQGEVNVVDGHVYEDTARPGGIFDEEAGWVMLVGRLRTYDCRSPNLALLDFTECALVAAMTDTC